MVVVVVVDDDNWMGCINHRMASGGDGDEDELNL